MTSNKQERIFRQAVEWFVELQSEHCDEQRRHRFQDWLSSHETHRQAYVEAEKLWSNLNDLKTMDIPSAYRSRNAGRPAGRVLRNGLSSVLLAALIGGWWQDYSAETLSFATGLGERRSVDLADGSHLQLNARTRLSVRLSWLRRRVELEEGEALFMVTHQAYRPFTVTMGQYSIRDIGTVFAVKKRPEGGLVSVLEGEVELSHGRSWFGDSLKAGFSRRIGADGHLQPVENADVEQSIAWTEGHLVFNHTPLAEITAELERHHAVHFVFADPDLATLTLSGSFDAADLKPFLHAVETILPIHATRRNQTIVLSKR